LNDADLQVRREAALALGRFRDNRIFVPLTRTLLDRHEDPWVRAGAADSLRRTGHKRALLALLKVVKRRNDAAKLAVVEALGAFNDDLAVRYLLLTIENSHEELQIRSQAMISLSRLDGNQAVEALLRLIQG
jgi:HEAT repeat protein